MYDIAHFSVGAAVTVCMAWCALQNWPFIADWIARNEAINMAIRLGSILEWVEQSDAVPVRSVLLGATEW